MNKICSDCGCEKDNVFFVKDKNHTFGTFCNQIYMGRNIIMNEKNTQSLLSEFSELYRDHKLPMTQTCMCWGFECGDGWFDLIYKLSKDITAVSKKVIADQVKEKFGGLRFYWHGQVTKKQGEKIDKLVEAAEEESYTICEQCGSREGVTQTRGWIVSLCRKCMKKYKKRKL